jgi:hypothetical protein
LNVDRAIISLHVGGGLNWSYCFVYSGCVVVELPRVDFWYNFSHIKWCDCKEAKSIVIGGFVSTDC